MFILFLLLTLSHVYSQELNFQFYDHPDVSLTLEQSLEKYGYPLEVHQVTTTDKYILTVFRIPHGRKSNTTNKSPVLLVHGLTGSSENYVTAVPYKSLGYYLADEGYDVWLINHRGSRHSRKHVFLNPDRDMKYWDFSWHEQATIDIPNTIDYILEKTKQKKVFYVGHSQGTTTYLALTCARPEYNDKIKLGVLLSPAAFLGYIHFPMLKLLGRMQYYIQMIAKLFNFYEFVPLPFRDTVLSTVKLFCSEMSIMADSCRQLVYFLSIGDNIDLKRLQVILNGAFAGASFKQMVHYFQLMDTKKFQQFDHGVEKNLRIYKSRKPPIYDLRNSSAPIAFFHSFGDVFNPPEQFIKFKKYLPNIYSNIEVPHFYHVDFVFADEIEKYVNIPLVKLFKQIDREEAAKAKKP